MSKPSTTNCPKLHAAAQPGLSGTAPPARSAAWADLLEAVFAFEQKKDYKARERDRHVACSRDISGGYSTVVPPLPIPNREVKHSRADGTAHPRESRSPPF